MRGEGQAKQSLDFALFAAYFCIRQRLDLFAIEEEGDDLLRQEGLQKGLGVGLIERFATTRDV